MSKRIGTILTIAVVMLFAGVMTTPASASEGNDARGVVQAPVSIMEAITAAEQHAQGIASRAEYEQGENGPVYDVEVVAGDKVLDIEIDAEKGTVLSSRQDKRDHDEDDDHEERDDE